MIPQINNLLLCLLGWLAVVYTLCNGDDDDDVYDVYGNTFING